MNNNHEDAGISALIRAGGGEEEERAPSADDSVGAASLPSHSVASDLQRRLDQLEAWAQQKTGQSKLTFGRVAKWLGILAGIFGVGYVLKSFGDATSGGSSLLHAVKGTGPMPPAPSRPMGYETSPIRHVQEFQAPPWAANWVPAPARPIFHQPQPAMLAVDPHTGQVLEQATYPAQPHALPWYPGR